MQIDKNKVLNVGNRSFWVVDYLFYRGEHYILATELFNKKDLGDKLYIFVERKENNQIYLERLRDQELLNYVCPIFEHNLKNNLK